MYRFYCKIFPVVIVCLLLGSKLSSQEQNDYWKISENNSIIWDLTKEDRLPHSENIEFSGLKVSTIIYYTIDKDRNLSLERDVIFPQLRTFNKSYEPDWRKYRAYYRKTVKDDLKPSITVDQKIIVPSQLDSIEINGWIKFYYTPINDLQIIKTIYPSREDRFIVEEWEILNRDKQTKNCQIVNVSLSLGEQGYKGGYGFHMYSDAAGKVMLQPSQSYTFPVYYGATLNEEKKSSFKWERAKTKRQAFLNLMGKNLVLKSPDSILNQLFYFSKIRAAESIFNSSMGKVHSPGGGNYYVGIWANDQIEYSGPFFPYLGYDLGKEAAYNAYAHFKKNIPDTGHIAYAFEVDGNFAMTHLDRGDAAMIAFGTAHFLLASGNVEQAKKLWPLVEWSLEYCHRNRNINGAVISESDEMEGRISTGDANLSTSSLYYGGLKYASFLASELGNNVKATMYKSRLKEMKLVIEDYFGADIEGLHTYKYFKENKFLRHWICLPLCMGIDTRKEGTIDALVNKLWTENGILVELNPEKKQDVFWDRATLYTLQGIFKVGEVELAFEKLKSLSRKRLLGDHVPYVVEAYPENNMKHLSAESALYCRIFTEGLLGIEPIGFGEIKIKPFLPEEWDFLELENIGLFGQDTDIKIIRSEQLLHLTVVTNNEIVFDEALPPHKEILLKLIKIKK